MDIQNIIIHGVIAVNIFMAGKYVGGEMTFYDTKTEKVLWLLLYLLFGATLWALLFVVASIWYFISTHLWPEIIFYKNFWFTSFYEKIIQEAKSNGEFFKLMDNFNLLGKHHDGITAWRLRRHVGHLNRRFGYTYSEK